MADEGYDVWLPNVRGNFYSRRHVFKDPNNPLTGFWNFSWDDIAFLDFPAMFDYIRRKTCVSKLYVIAHSQGTSSMMALLSEKPEYNQYFHAVSLLAPVSYIHNSAILLEVIGNLQGPLQVIFHFASIK